MCIPTNTHRETQFSRCIITGDDSLATDREMHVSIPFPLGEILKYIFILTCQLLESFLYICAFDCVSLYNSTRMLLYMCFNFVCPFLSSSPSSLNALPLRSDVDGLLTYTYYNTTTGHKPHRASGGSTPCVRRTFCPYLHQNACNLYI